MCFAELATDAIDVHSSRDSGRIRSSKGPITTVVKVTGLLPRNLASVQHMQHVTDYFDFYQHYGRRLYPNTAQEDNWRQGNIRTISSTPPLYTRP
jgi:hypothetical protein